MEHATTPYYEPKIFKTPAPELKKKRVPWIHMGICFLTVAAFIGIAIYSLAQKADFISNGGLQGVLFTVEGIVIICAHLVSGFLLIRKQWHFAWPFLATFVVAFVMELIFTFWNPPTTPEQLAALVTLEKLEQLGVATIIFLLMFPLFGSLSDKLKLYKAHRELFET